MRIVREVVIASATRTAIGNFNGSLASLSAPELGAAVIISALDRARASVDIVNEVIMGNVLQSGLGQNPARQASLAAGVPASVPAFTVNKVCGSGLKAVVLAAQAVAVGEADVVVAGGMESMSNAPYLLDKARRGYRMGHGSIVDSMIQDGLWCAINNYHMGITAENVADLYGVGRADQDLAASQSQVKALKAIACGAFKREVTPVTVKGKNGDKVFDTDEFPKPGTTLDSLSGLRPAFKKDGTVTAGNASGINDGAAAVVVTSAEKAKALGVKPLARIVSYGVGAIEPSIMGMGPVPATRAALGKAGLSIEDIDLIEANEAFAAQFLAVAKELGFPAEKVNVHGGAIALGHPIGASGTRILVTLLHALQQRNARYGLATLCIGGGQGIAAIVERL